MLPCWRRFDFLPYRKKIACAVDHERQFTEAKERFDFRSDIWIFTIPVNDNHHSVIIVLFISFCMPFFITNTPQSQCIVAFAREFYHAAKYKMTSNDGIYNSSNDADVDAINRSMRNHLTTSHQHVDIVFSLFLSLSFTSRLDRNVSHFVFGGTKSIYTCSDFVLVWMMRNAMDMPCCCYITQSTITINKRSAPWKNMEKFTHISTIRRITNKIMQEKIIALFDLYWIL